MCYSTDHDVLACACTQTQQPTAEKTTFGPCIPTAYFVTSGTGESDEETPLDPYETFSYDLALQEVGIDDFNVVYYTYKPRKTPR